MSAQRPGLLSYLSLFFGTTLATASGAMSVVAAGVALYVNPRFTKDSFFGIAGLSALSATYQVWAQERILRTAAEAYLDKSDLKIILLRSYRSQGAPWLLLEAIVTNQSIGVAAITNLECWVRLSASEVKNIGWTDVDQRAFFRAGVLGTLEFTQAERQTPCVSRM